MDADQTTIRLFGAPRIEASGGASPIRAAPKALELLGYLCARATPIARDTLATALWPDADHEERRANLRRQLHNLTRALPAADPPHVLSSFTTLQWNPHGPARVDVIEFRSAVRDGGDPVPWYGGDFLEGFYDDWVLAEREDARSAAIAALFERIRRKRGERDLRAALEDVGRLLALDPWREDAVRIEMTLRRQLGDRGGALATYRAFSARLLRELESEPMPETFALYDAIARGDELATDGVASAARIERADRRALPFIGRATELERAREAWAAAARGRGSLLLIGGEAGVGKSRLAAELALLAEAQGGHVIVGTTSPGETSPHEALVEALRAALPAIENAVRDDAAFAALLPLLPELEARHRLIAAPAGGDPASRMRLFEAVAGTLTRLAAKRPLLIVLEDVHWAGAGSLDLVQFLVRRAGSSAVLFLATYREEAVRATHPLRALRKHLEAENLATVIALARLADGDAATIVRGALAGADERAVAAIVAESAGLPLFLNEAIRAPGRAPDAERLNVAERLAALPSEARTLVDIAAVAGTGFDVDLLCEASGWAEADVVHALGALVAARLVRESYRRTRTDYVFSHHLIASAIYDGVPHFERTRRHGLIASAIAAGSGERSRERAAEIAAHYARAERRDDAARWYAHAAEGAASLWATDDALAYAARAIELGDDATEIARMQLLRLDIAIARLLPAIVDESLAALDTMTLTPDQEMHRDVRRARRLRSLGRIDEVAALIAHMLARAPETVERFRSEILWEQSLLAVAQARYDDAEAFARDHARRAFGTEFSLEIAQVALRRGDFERMLALSTRVRDAAIAAGNIVAEGHAQLFVGIAEQNRAHFDAAEAAYARCRELYVRCDQRAELISLDVNRAALSLARADYNDAIQTCAALIRRGDDINAGARWCAQMNAALAHACLGNSAQALALLAERLPDDSVADETAAWYMADGFARWSDDPRAALASFARARDIRRELASWGHFALVSGCAALCALEVGNRTGAVAAAREAAAIPAERRCESDFPHVALWALAATTRGRAARDAFDATLAAYREREAMFGNDEGRRAYAAVPWNARFLQTIAAGGSVAAS